MQISGSTRVFMVIGDPITQVQAPALFNPVFRRFDIDAVLVPAHVRAGQAPEFARHVLQAGNIDGLWVTVPHKPALLPLLAGVDRHARIAGSVNAVRRHSDGTLQGGLFDGTGLVSALRHVGIEPQGLRVLLVGTGGAGAAIAAALLDSGVASLALQDLGRRADELAARLQAARAAEGLGCAPLLTGPRIDLASQDLVIHATPLGLKPDDPLPIDVSRLSPGTKVYDILMKTCATPLLRACAAHGIEAHAGFEMLVQQVPDYLGFFGLHDAAAALRGDLVEVRRSVGTLP
ncbi:MAG: hypothetical protein RJA44_1290 [Pseudomonadota bacterium]|jgi:shikimate dehydrogenase